MGVAQEPFWLKVTRAPKLSHRDVWPQTYRAKFNLAIIISEKQNVCFSESIAVTTFIFGSNEEASESFWSISQFDLHFIFKITEL